MHDYAAQRQWETYARDRGLWRYRQSLTREVQRGANAGARVARALSDLEPGQRIADELIAPLAARIETEQAAIHQKLAGERVVVNPVDWILLSLPAEVLAVTTVLAALSRTEPAPLQSCTLDLGNKVQREVELRYWRKAEKDAQHAREQAAAEWMPNLYELMVKRNDKVDERVFRKWSAKSKTFLHEDWEPSKRKGIGARLLGWLIESDAWFEAVEVREGAKSRDMFQLTDMARAWIARRNAQNELSRPFLLPMICEPRDYEYLPPPPAAVEVNEDETCMDESVCAVLN